VMPTSTPSSADISATHATASIYLFFYCYVPLRAPHSFPTRRSSDLTGPPPCRGPTKASSGPASRFIIGTTRCLPPLPWRTVIARSEEHTSELQSRFDLVCRLLLEKKKKRHKPIVLYHHYTRNTPQHI